MGPRTWKDQSSTEKDRHIDYLESLLRAYTARTSHLQTRLHATLDTLDALVRSHAQELGSETQAKEELSRRLDSYIDVVKQAEIERDDMRDAVLELIQKVELTNDYTLWPRSRMQVAGHIDSVVPNQDPRVNDSDLHQLSYSSAIIASLRSERDMERAAHKRTRREAEDRIAALEAQVRNREAELEACSILTHAETCSRRVHDQPPFCSVHGQPMTRSHLNPSHSDMLRSIPTRHDDMVRAASARNKALEMEVKGLFERLKMARAEPYSPTSHASHVVEDHEDATDLCLDCSTPAASSFVVANSSSLSFSQPRCIHMISASPNTSDLARSSSSPSRARGESYPITALPFRSRRYPLPSPDDPTTPKPDGWVPTRPPPGMHSSAIWDLEQQVMALAAKVDTFKEEREILTQALARERQDRSVETDITGDLDLAELTMEQRAPSEQWQETLQYEPKESHEAAMAREEELLKEIERLQILVARVAPTNEVDSQSFAAKEPPLIEEYDGEMSMELATPINLPAPLPSNDGESFTVDRMSTPPPRSPPLSDLTPSVSTPTQNPNMMQVEKDLAAVQQRLANGENEVRRLRLLAADLHLRISQTGTPREKVEL